jgi:hypothetical protein
VASEGGGGRAERVSDEQIPRPRLRRKDQGKRHQPGCLLACVRACARGRTCVCVCVSACACVCVRGCACVCLSGSCAYICVQVRCSLRVHCAGVRAYVSACLRPHVRRHACCSRVCVCVNKCADFARQGCLQGRGPQDSACEGAIRPNSGACVRAFESVRACVRVCALTGGWGCRNPSAVSGP